MGGNGEYTVSATNQLLLILTTGLASSIICGFATCSASSSCTLRGTCESVDGGFCSFKNKVGITTDAIYLFNASADALAGLLRGICSPGDRAHMNTTSEEVECVPYFPFPSAINEEIMDPAGTTPAAKACGKWIDAGGMVSSVIRRGLYDNNNWIAELERVEDEETTSPRVAHNGMSKFRAECQRTATAGASALRSSAAMAFRNFETYFESTAVDRNGFLKSLGYVTSHYCETPVRMAYRLSSSYVVAIFNGYWFGEETLSDSLFLYNEPLEVQRDANEANMQIRDWYRNGQSANLSTAEKYQIMLGASDMSSLSYTESIYSTTLVGAALRYYDEHPEKAMAYLKGLGAFCSFETFADFIKYDRSSQFQPTYDRLAAEMRSIRDSRPAASALARLTQVGDSDTVDISSDSLKASSVTFASLIGDGSTGNPTVDCLTMMRKVFPDEVEAARFNKIVPTDFYNRLQPLVLSVRVAMGLAAQTAPIKATISNTTTFERIVAEAGVRIIGAPRGSWAGESKAIPTAELSSDDGMFGMILKQSRATYKHALIDAVTDASIPICDHEPMYSELIWNAYATRIADRYCCMFFLGMAHRPLMDPFYDDSSLAGRGLFVFGHEFAHFAQISDLVSASSQNAGGLLKHYYTVTHSEAYADVFAAVAVLVSGMVTRSDFDTHHCQVWCSRQPWWYTQPPNQVHPGGNDRCNFLIQTLDEFFPTLGR